MDEVVSTYLIHDREMFFSTFYNKIFFERNCLFGIQITQTFIYV